jgi:isopropylmalate/homocitrate/citramalate synthase
MVEQVERTTDGGVDVGVTLMDPMRAVEGFLASCARGAVSARAASVTAADTTGAGTPEEVRRTVETPGAELVDVAEAGVHAHDDMAVATANSAAGVTAGADRVDVTVGGIGERAGNAPLEEVAVLLAERGEPVPLVLDEMVPACRRVHDLLGVDVPPAKPVIGHRAYRHESGLHTAAMLQEPST